MINPTLDQLRQIFVEVYIFNETLTNQATLVHLIRKHAKNDQPHFHIANYRTMKEILEQIYNLYYDHRYAPLVLRDIHSLNNTIRQEHASIIRDLMP